MKSEFGIWQGLIDLIRYEDIFPCVNNLIKFLGQDEYVWSKLLISEHRLMVD
jgi:hypothetical protein